MAVFGRCLVVLVITAVMDNVIAAQYDIVVSETGSTENIRFIYYSTPYTWDRARATCLSIGGDLAKLNSVDVFVFLAKAKAEDGLFLENDYFGGLWKNDDTKPERRWVSDCSLLTYNPNYDPNERYHSCYDYDISRSVDHGRLSDCARAKPFLCQVKKTTALCYITDVMSLDVHSKDVGSVSDYYDCKAKCLEIFDCWVAIFVADICHHFKRSSTGGPQIQLGVKSCYHAEINTTNPNTPDPIDDMSICNNDTLSSTLAAFTSVMPSPSSSSPLMTSQHVTTTHIPTPPCSCVNSTISVTTTAICTPSQVIVPTTVPCSVMASSTSTTPALVPSPTPVKDETEEIVANLTVDVKNTSSYQRRHISASDKRASSMYIGVVGIVVTVVPLSLLVIMDLKQMILDRVSMCSKGSLNRTRPAK